MSRSQKFITDLFRTRSHYRHLLGTFIFFIPAAANSAYSAELGSAIRLNHTSELIDAANITDAIPSFGIEMTHEMPNNTDTDTKSEPNSNTTQSTAETTEISPDLILVKRVTAINRGKSDQRLFDDIYIDDDAADDNANGWPQPIEATSGISTFLAGKVSEKDVEPGDEVEYTIYFLNRGSDDLAEVSICDVLRQPDLGVADLIDRALEREDGIELHWGDRNTPNSTVNVTNMIDDPDQVDEDTSNRNAAVGCNSPLLGQSLRVYRNVSGSAMVTFEGVGDPNQANATKPNYGFIRLRTVID